MSPELIIGAVIVGIVVLFLVGKLMPKRQPKNHISNAPAVVLCRGIPSGLSRRGATTKPNSSARHAIPNGFNPDRHKNASASPLLAVLGLAALALFCCLL